MGNIWQKTAKKNKFDDNNFLDGSHLAPKNSLEKDSESTMDKEDNADSPNSEMGIQEPSESKKEEKTERGASVSNRIPNKVIPDSKELENNKIGIQNYHKPIESQSKMLGNHSNPNPDGSANNEFVNTKNTKSNAYQNNTIPKQKNTNSKDSQNQKIIKQQFTDSNVLETKNIGNQNISDCNDLELKKIRNQNNYRSKKSSIHEKFPDYTYLSKKILRSKRFSTGQQMIIDVVLEKVYKNKKNPIHVSNSEVVKKTGYTEPYVQKCFRKFSQEKVIDSKFVRVRIEDQGKAGSPMGMMRKVNFKELEKEKFGN